MVSDDPESFADLDGHQGSESEEESELAEKENEEFDKEVTKAESAVAARQTPTPPTPDIVNEMRTKGYDNPVTGECFAPNPSFGRASMRAQDGTEPEPPQLKEGKEAHRNEPVRPGEKPEVQTPSGRGRMDRYNEKDAHIREIKPNNKRGIRSGQKQLERYKKEMDAATQKNHTTELTLYNKTMPKQEANPVQPEQNQ